MLLFISGIVLKYKKKDLKRTYKVPFGNAGMWIISGLGLIGVTFTFIMGFFPPPDVKVTNLFFFEGFLIIGICSMIAAPFIIDALKKPSWILSPRLGGAGTGRGASRSCGSGPCAPSSRSRRRRNPRAPPAPRRRRSLGRPRRGRHSKRPMSTTVIHLKLRKPFYDNDDF